jgi:hypothetical protein
MSQGRIHPLKPETFKLATPKPATLLLFSLGLGLSARLVQYAFNRSLWLDEAFLALNLLRRDFAGLLGPLDDYQTAPAGFLWVEKALVRLLGDSEYALRLFPLLGGLAAVFLFYHLAKTSLGMRGTLLAVTLLSWSQPLIYFASEVKPYATDVLCAVLVYELCLPWLDDGRLPSWRRVMLVGLAGAALVWFSYPVVFVLASLGVALLLRPLIGWQWRACLRLAVVPLAWAAGLALLYVLAPGLRSSLDSGFLQSFWGSFFASFPPRSISDVYWFAQLFFDFLVQSAGMPFYGLAALLWLAGLVALWQKGRWPVALSLSLPLGLAAAAAALHRYPFYGRTLLFAVPPTFLLVAEGAWAVYSSVTRDSRVIALLLLLVLFFHPFYRTAIVLAQPLTTEEIKPVLQHVRDNWQTGDRLYVYHGSARPFEYYAPRYGLDDERLYRLGRASNGEFSVLVQDVEALGSGRAWFLFTHVYTFGGISEEAFILERLGDSRLDAFSAPGATVYLYELDG